MSAAMAPASLTAWDLNGWSKHHLGRVEDALSRWVGIEAPAGLGDAMRYAVLDGGKRLRPLLVLAAYEAALSAQSTALDVTQRSGADEAALRAACAVWPIFVRLGRPC